MSFKEFLNEQKIKFNADNWSGGTDEVNIDEKKMSFKSKEWSGKFENLKDDTIKVIVDGYKHAPIYVYKLKNSWVAEMDGIDRSDTNPVVAALKLANNVF